jgi:ATP-dependent Clp protease adaptor protein ClpS
MVKTDTQIEEQIRAIFSGDTPWVTIVWDDPVNLMTYVTYVLMELFGFSKEKAHELMMKVHTEGKAIVSTGSREEMEHDVARLHEYGLWATLQREDQALGPQKVLNATAVILMSLNLPRMNARF